MALPSGKIRYETLPHVLIYSAHVPISTEVVGPIWVLFLPKAFSTVRSSWRLQWEPAGRRASMTVSPSRLTMAWDQSTISAFRPVKFNELVRFTHQPSPSPRADIVLMGE